MDYRSDLSASWLRAVFFLAMLFQGLAHASIETTRDTSIALEIELQIKEWQQNPQLAKRHTLQQLDNVHAFYLSRNYLPAWRNHNRLLLQADDFIRFTNKAHLHGISTAGLHLDSIAILREKATRFDRAKLDILLTDAFMTLSLQAAQGKLNPLEIDEQWHHQRPEVDVVSLLTNALTTGDIAESLESLLPHNNSYQQLIAALAFYRELAQKGPWPQLAAQGPLLKYGINNDEVVKLRQRLRLSGDLAVDATDTAYFDDRLENAVKHFQKRHGLAVDGVVGRNTRAALNTPVEQRIQQIMLNLERWRWLPRELGERHIRIDLAGFRLQVYDKDNVPLSMRVIVGKDKRKTPAFSSNMYHLMFNPYWNVPDIIAFEDMLPKIKRNPEYLARNHIRIIKGYGQKEQELDYRSVDWSLFEDVTDLPFRFRQDPGAINSMGRIKFMLPNPFEINLHDTPSKHLFTRPMRTYSSGCIRVEDPVALAEYVMGDKWQQSDIQKILDGKQNQIHHLPEPIPVHMLYQTAWVDQDGTVQFRKDVYNKDKLLLAALQKASKPVNARDENNTGDELKALGYWKKSAVNKTRTQRRGTETQM
jgi:murein L,D-transpeptidase YcbB/YkuD